MSRHFSFPEPPSNPGPPSNRNMRFSPQHILGLSTSVVFYLPASNTSRARLHWSLILGKVHCRGQSSAVRLASKCIIGLQLQTENDRHPETKTSRCLEGIRACWQHYGSQ